MCATWLCWRSRCSSSSGATLAGARSARNMLLAQALGWLALLSANIWPGASAVQQLECRPGGGRFFIQQLVSFCCAGRLARRAARALRAAGALRADAGRLRDRFSRVLAAYSLGQRAVRRAVRAARRRCAASVGAAGRALALALALCAVVMTVLAVRARGPGRFLCRQLPELHDAASRCSTSPFCCSLR